MAKPTAELPAVEIREHKKKTATYLSIPKATAYAYRRRKFERFYKKGVRQAAAALLGCNVKAVYYNARLEIYFCLASAATHPQDLGQETTPRKRYRPKAW